MATMYGAKVNSPITTLTASINSTVTTISVADTSVLPSAPNLLTIGSGEDAETCRYTAIIGNDVTVERGFQGVAKEWDSGTPLARNFTAYDHDSFIENIEASSLVLESTTETADYTLALTDAGKVVAMNKATNGIVTVPANSSVAFPIGTVINIYNMTDTLLTITGGTGVTVINAGVMTQYGEVSIRKRDTDEWVLVGAAYAT